MRLDWVHGVLDVWYPVHPIQSPTPQYGSGHAPILGVRTLLQDRLEAKHTQRTRAPARRSTPRGCTTGRTSAESLDLQ